MPDPMETARLRGEIRELRAERDSLEKLLEGNIPEAASWLQSKVWRQRRALDRLERRNGTLRFALRLMNTVREPVTTAEWTSARAAIAHESQRGRISEQVPAVS